MNTASADPFDLEYNIDTRGLDEFDAESGARGQTLQPLLAVVPGRTVDVVFRAIERERPRTRSGARWRAASLMGVAAVATASGVWFVLNWNEPVRRSALRAPAVALPTSEGLR